MMETVTFVNVYEDMTALMVRLKALEAAAGNPRPLAESETATEWREITLGKQKFRVLTLEDKQ